VAIGKDPFAVRGFAECNWHSAKTGSPVVAHLLKHHKNEEALYSHVAEHFSAETIRISETKTNNSNES